MLSMENVEYGKYGVWKMRSVENVALSVENAGIFLMHPGPCSPSFRSQFYHLPLPATYHADKTMTVSGKTFFIFYALKQKTITV